MATAPPSQAFTDTTHTNNYAVTAVVVESGAPVAQTMDHQGERAPDPLGGYVCVCVCVCVHVCLCVGTRLSVLTAIVDILLQHIDTYAHPCTHTITHTHTHTYMQNPALGGSTPPL
jgi:hypothetical protein